MPPQQSNMVYHIRRLLDQNAFLYDRVVELEKRDDPEKVSRGVGNIFDSPSRSPILHSRCPESMDGVQRRPGKGSLPRRYRQAGRFSSLLSEKKSSSISEGGLPVNVPARAWSYEKSVSKMRPLVVRWKTLTDEMLEELYRAREALSRKRERTESDIPTWTQYLADIGLPRQTAHDWLSSYDADKHKRIEALEVHHSSESNEWTTPPAIVEVAKKMFGVIDLDPCSNDEDAPAIPAQEIFTQKDDGLNKEWHGRVYMNPPYGDEIRDWILKLKGEYEAGNVSEAIALVPARPDTAWFRELRQYSRCFIFGRLKFGGQENSAPFPSMLVYLGKNIKQFRDLVGAIGDVYKLYE